jgi:hypothetical protein
VRSTHALNIARPTPKFPANREINREFFNFGPDRGSEVAIRPMIQDLERNSLRNRTGNYFEGTGNFGAGTGILLAKTEIVAG